MFMKAAVRIVKWVGLAGVSLQDWLAGHAAMLLMQ
jgi:hypothetical protein